MTEVNKSQLAKHLGVKPSMVTKHVKSGILDKCFTSNGKKLYLERAIEAIAFSRKRDNDKTIKDTVPKNVQNDSSLFNEESSDELKFLLMDSKSPSQKVQIIKDFWLGKINRQKFLESEGELIPVSDAKAAVETLLSPLNQYLDDQANNLKNNFSDLSDEVVKWIVDENNRQKEQLREYIWEN